MTKYTLIFLSLFFLTNVSAEEQSISTNINTATEEPAIEENDEVSSNDIITEGLSLDKPSAQYLQIQQDFDVYKTKSNDTVKALQDSINKNFSNIEASQLRLDNSLKTTNRLVKNELTDIKRNYSKLSEKYVKLSGEHIKLSDEYALFRIDTENEVNELRQSISTASEQMDIAKNNATRDISEITKTIDENILYWIISILVVILMILSSFVLSRSLFSRHRIDVAKSITDTRKVLEEEHVKIDSKLIELIESQVKIIDSANEKGDNGNEDHTLALKVADEIVRIHKNTIQMDANTKGIKQLVASVNRIKDNFASNGYEITDMLGKDYDEGMKATVNFIPDDDLESGKRIITKVIKPQVNYQGQMIQAAQIEVSEG